MVDILCTSRILAVDDHLMERVTVPLHELRNLIASVLVLGVHEDLATQIMVKKHNVKMLAVLEYTKSILSISSRYDLRVVKLSFNPLVEVNIALWVVFQKEY
jgi:hypothetical protein